MRKSTWLRVAALAAGLALVGAACGDDDDTTKTTDAGAGSTAAGAPVDTSATTAAGGETPGGAAGALIPTGVKCDAGLKIAFLGALSGDNGALGQNMVDGAAIAFDQFNKANPDCQITFTGTDSKEFDSQGDPVQAPALADKIVSDDKIVGLIGPGFSGETKATMPTFEAASLAMITPGATNAKLSTNGWKSFHRILANDDKQAPGIVKYIQGSGATKVGVVDDASEYGKGLADSVRSGLGALKVADATVDPKAADFKAAVDAMKAAGVDTVFYSGYYAEAAKMVKQLADAGVKAKFVSGDGSLDKGFIDGAGAAAEGAVLTATGAPADVNPEFQAAFKAKFSKDPALYSPEAYDCAVVFLQAIAKGNVTRATIRDFIGTYDADGITKRIKFDATGEPEGDAVFYTVVEGGKLVAKGLIK